MRVCEDATFAKRVSVGMSCKTIPDIDDGFANRTPACRKYTLLREDQNSRIYATIPGQTSIGPVLRVHIIGYLDISGIEIQIPSTTTKDRTSWVARDWVPKACPEQAAADPRGSRTCVNTFSIGLHTQGEKGESRRPAVAPSSRRGKYLQLDARREDWAGRTEGRLGCPQGKSGRHVVRGRQSSPILECAQVTGKAGENGQY